MGILDYLLVVISWLFPSPITVNWPRLVFISRYLAKIRRIRSSRPLGYFCTCIKETHIPPQPSFPNNSHSLQQLDNYIHPKCHTSSLFISIDPLLKLIHHGPFCLSLRSNPPFGLLGIISLSTKLNFPLCYPLN